MICEACLKRDEEITHLRNELRLEKALHKLTEKRLRPSSTAGRDTFGPSPDVGAAT